MIRLILSILFVTSCTSIDINGITREQGYNIAQKAMYEKYNIHIPKSKMGFYIKNKKWNYLAFVDNDVYLIEITSKGDVENIAKKE